MSSFIRAGSINAPMTPDPEGAPSQLRLQPFVSIGGIDQYSLNCSQLQSPTNLEDGNGATTPIKRLSLAVAPIQSSEGGSSINYPNSGSSKWLVNLDSQQLYTGPLTSETSAGYKFGESWLGPSTEGSNCYDKYGESDGAYTIPVPVQGAPVEFRKIYFKGQNVDANGAAVSGASGCNSYFAYFACSLPVKQDCNVSGTAYNPRNENFGIMDGEVDAWENFDISCAGGSGGSGCSNVYSKVSITGYELNTGVFAGGCNGNVIFATSGCMTGDGSFSHDIRQEGNDTIVTYSVNPNFVKSVSGGLYTASVSGCDRSINFETAGCDGGSYPNALTVQVNELSDGNVNVIHSINTADLIGCLGYEERDVEVCEGGSVVSYTFLTKI